MPHMRRPPSDNSRLREIAAILQRAYALRTGEASNTDDNLLLSDLLLALENPELRDILCEMKALQAEQLERLERLLARHADNDP
jgi:hypothetical protein